METRLSSATKEVVISDKGPTILIGERINPTGKKKMSAALKSGDLGFICKEALAQVKAGADMLDVNVGLVDVDEVALLPQAVRAIMDTVNVPLCLDSSNPDALEAAIKIYRGKPLVNSVTGEERSLEMILPLVKKYKTAVVGLTMDDEGIPNDADKRTAIAYKIVKRAEALGIPPKDIIIDCLAQPVGADERAGLVTIQAIRKIKAKLSVNMTLGGSNISFGLPDRNLVNSAFLAIVIAKGITSIIADADRVRPIILATDLVIGHDIYAMRYIKAYQQQQLITKQVFSQG